MDSFIADAQYLLSAPTNILESAHDDLLKVIRRAKLLLTDSDLHAYWMDVNLLHAISVALSRRQQLRVCE